MWPTVYRIFWFCPTSDFTDAKFGHPWNLLSGCAAFSYSWSWNQKRNCHVRSRSTGCGFASMQRSHRCECSCHLPTEDLLDPNYQAVIDRGLAGINTIPNFKVVVRCLSRDANGAEITVNVSIGLFPADGAGNAHQRNCRFAFPMPSSDSICEISWRCIVCINRLLGLLLSNRG